MGRWRPPAPRSSPYITATGFQILQDELNGLWVRRKDVTKALSAAAAEGDRSENAEYIYRKKELAGIDRRIRYLQRRLPALTIVDSKPSDPEKVFFSAWVTLEDEAGEEITYRIVGGDEIDSSKGWISLDSPMAKALMRKGIDDDVVVETPKGATEYIIVAVHYDGDEPQL